MIEIGCSTLGYRHDSLDTALAEIASQGFRRLDLVTAPSIAPTSTCLTSFAGSKDALQEKLSEMGFTLSTLNTGARPLWRPALRQLAIDHARA